MQPNETAEKLLIASTSFFRSELDGGLYVHIGLELTPTKCTILLPTFTDSPVQPQIAQMNAAHTEQLHLFRERDIVTKAVKNQITIVFVNSFTA